MFNKIRDKLKQVFIKTENEFENENLPVIEEENKSKNLENKENILKKTFSKITTKKITKEKFENMWIELEIFLLEINIAYKIVEEIKINLEKEILGKNFDRFSLNKKIKEVLINQITEILEQRQADFLKIIKEKKTPVKILILGVNGSGKTTTIAKIIKYLKDNNLNCVVSASDTFRAGATEQLEHHCKNLNVKMIKHSKGSDPASVAFDSIEHAKAKKIPIVLIDTAGRMPNNSNLMLELKKIYRVSKTDLTIFIGDSISGVDLIEQIKLFNSIISLDGIILTKTDTDEKPGSIVSTAFSIEKPIFFLGIGQNYEDLVKFDPKNIAKQLFELENEEK